MKPLQIFSTANILTILRVVLTPLIIISEIRERSVLSFVIFGLIGTSDVFDGLLARWTGNDNRFGAVFDLAADFFVIFSLFLLFYWKGIFPLLLLIFAFLSAVTFCLNCLAKKGLSKNTIGQYTGAVLFGGVLTYFFVRLFLKDLYAPALRVIIAASLIYLAISIIENIVILFKRLKSNIL
ncbi:hypothetical protein ES703_72837 [subsurface metagenome]